MVAAKCKMLCVCVSVCGVRCSLFGCCCLLVVSSLSGLVFRVASFVVRCLLRVDRCSLCVVLAVLCCSSVVVCWLAIDGCCVGCRVGCRLCFLARACWRFRCLFVGVSVCLSVVCGPVLHFVVVCTCAVVARCVPCVV